MAAASSVAQPRTIEVQICGGAHRLVVRPWTMGQRSELQPHIAALIDAYAEWQDKPAKFSLAATVLALESHCNALAHATVQGQLRDLGITWDELWLEDEAGLIQAVWETSFIRPGGGGLVGKLGAAFGPMLAGVLKQMGGAAGTTTQQSSPRTSSAPSSPASASSPGAGAPTPSASAGR